MKIAVLVKQTPDTETVVKIKPDGSDIVAEGIKFVPSPYDEYAIEEALRTKEKFGGEVIVVSLGPARAMETIRTALAMGVDRGIHLDDPAFEGGDAYATAKAIATALKKESPDVVFAGRQAIDGDNFQVHARVAEILGVPQVLGAAAIEWADGGKKATVVRRIEGGEEVVEVQMPAVVSCEKGLNEPRYASLPGIMKAKKKPVAAVKAADLGLAGQAGAAGSKLKRVKLVAPPERKAGRIIKKDTPEEAAKELVKLLREEAKVI